AAAAQRPDGSDKSPPRVQLTVAEAFDQSDDDEQCQLASALVSPGRDVAQHQRDESDCGAEECRCVDHHDEIAPVEHAEQCGGASDAEADDLDERSGSSEKDDIGERPERNCAVPAAADHVAMPPQDLEQS